MMPCAVEQVCLTLAMADVAPHLSDEDSGEVVAESVRDADAESKAGCPSMLRWGRAGPGQHVGTRAASPANFQIWGHACMRLAQ
jgi:hypothetical protein